MKRRLYSVVALALSCLLTVCTAKAQQRESQQELGSRPGNLTHSLRDHHDPSAGSRPVTRPPQRLGRKFWILWAAAIGLAIADVEITAHCIERPACAEGNPFLGKRPSRGRMYAIKGVTMGLGFYVSRRWKREDTSGWTVPPIAAIGVGGTAVMVNLARGFPRKAQPETPRIANMPASQIVPLPVERSQPQ